MPNLATSTTLRVVSCSVVLAVLSGCSTQTSAPTTSQSERMRAAADQPNPFHSLQKGMTADAVRATVGEPMTIEPFPSQAVKSEVWVYRHTVGTTTTQEATSVRQVETVNPITGEMGTTPQAALQTVVIDITDTVKLLMIEGRLVEWKTSREASRHFN